MLPVSPLVQEGQKIPRGERPCILEFAMLLAVDQLPIGVKHGQSWNAALHRDVVLCHQILVLLSLSDVHMHDLIVGGYDRRQFRTMKSLVEHMAVVAPVCAKHEDDTLVFRARLLSELP